MENIQEETKHYNSVRLTLAERLKNLEGKVKLKDRDEETKKKTKQFKFPFRWRTKFSQSKRKNKRDMMLVFFLNKKNELEPPKFMPIFDGNMIVWKNKPYEFDPRAVWAVRGMRGSPKVYFIKEIDRRPVMNKYDKFIYKDSSISNMDLGEVKARGDYTGSDEFLIKAALKAQTSRMKKDISIMTIILVAIGLIGGFAWFMFS